MIKTSFINVDLELSSLESLAPLADELDGKVFVLQNGVVDSEYQLAFECLMDGSEADAVCNAFIELIGSLSSASKDILSRCNSRVLDIGFDSGEDCIVTNLISGKLLVQIASYGFDIKITVYPVDKT